MEYKTKSGFVLTDEMIEVLGKAAERGDLPGKAGRFIVAPPGRPKICPSEDLVTLAFKVPKSQRDLLDAKAKKRNATRSELLREVLDEVLTAS